MSAIVYIATNRVNGRRYIGATGQGLAVRRRQHENEAKKQNGNCRRFHWAIRKHGSEAFDWLILVECDDLDSALLEERRLISEIGPEYNLTPGGQGNTRPRNWTAEARERWRQKMVGRKYPPEVGEKIRQAHLGKKRSLESRARMSAARKGIKFSEAHLLNLSIAHQGKKQSAETIEKRRRKALGKVPTPEHREKIAAALRGKKRPLHVGLAVAASNRVRWLRSADQLEMTL